jgi:hypothetical protein
MQIAIAMANHRRDMCALLKLLSLAVVAEGLTAATGREGSAPERRHHETSASFFGRAAATIQCIAALAASIFARIASRLKLAPFCIGGNSIAVCASLPTSSWTNTKRQNSNWNHVWTTPWVQEPRREFWRAVDCDHVFGLSTRHNDRWPRWGSRSGPKQSNDFESHWFQRVLRILGSTDRHLCQLLHLGIHA